MGKLPTARSTSATQPILNAEILRHWFGQGSTVESMSYPEFEPGTFGVAAGSPNHYTAFCLLYTDEFRHRFIVRY